MEPNDESGGQQMEMIALFQRAKTQLSQVTGLSPVAISGAYRDDKGWHVRMDLLEMSRIPTATDVLGDYEALLADDGSLLRFDRKRTRLRGAPMEEDGSEERR